LKSLLTVLSSSLCIVSLMGGMVQAAPVIPATLSAGVSTAVIAPTVAGAVVGAPAMLVPTAAGVALGGYSVTLPVAESLAAQAGVTVDQVVQAGLANVVPGTVGTPAPQALLGVPVTALIQGAAIGMAAYIIYQAVTGELQPPTVSLVEEGHSAPSGKAYRYQN
jgi:hypothetical protein